MKEEIAQLLIVLDRIPALGTYANSADPVQFLQSLHCLHSEISVQNTVKAYIK